MVDKTKKWTQEEKELLFNNLDKTIYELIELFNGKFSESAIRGQLYRNNLQCKWNRDDYWTEEEDNIIKNNLHLGTYRLLQLLPNRTKDALYHRCRKLNLSIPYIDDWQYEEIELLKKLCDGTKTYKDLTNYFPNKTQRQISIKCVKLKLNNKVKSLKPKTWTKDEIAFLKQNYNKLSIEEIQQTLDRSNISIVSKASKLKLTNNNAHPWTDEENRLLEELYKQGVDKSTVYEIFSYRTYPSIKGRLAQFPFKFKNNYTAKDGITQLDSLEEKKVFHFIYDNYETDIEKYYRSQSDYKFNDIQTGQRFIPDLFLTEINGIKLDKPLFIEYYGFCVDNTKYSVVMKYKEKMKRKNNYYKSRNDIYFIDFYPNDLKDNCKGIKFKLDNFINNLVKKSEVAS